MDKEVKEALITASTIAMAIVVTVPLALTAYNQGLRPLLDKKKELTNVKKETLPPRNPSKL